MGSAGGAAAAYMYLKRKKKENKMKWECVEVRHHKDVGGSARVSTVPLVALAKKIHALMVNHLFLPPLKHW